ncbi:hypothetical protein FSP39_010901 [Pinctada imbricata]|uniref:Golgi to ER traffic protein 4 homolog n=1 Tax=Pinctada imbricata TaxID=66713 RepID=A0AA88XQE5_PINIB|nr:hypothetical protein FSP39_010901 [Pinctada imbricata]
MSGRSGGVDRVLAKCQACVDAGNYYEAHQMYRTLYFRYKGQKKYPEAINLLYNGALLLLNHNQHQSGTDLALLLVDLLNQSMTQVTEELVEKIGTLFRSMDCTNPDRHNFMVSAVRWSMKVDNQHTRGHPELHKAFGTFFWREKNYIQARYHFLHSTDGRSCATMLIEYHTNFGYPSEVDLFIAQAVLQYLCLQNKETARVVFVTYTKEHPDVTDGPPYVTPLLNFIWFLLLALEGGRVTVFSILCEKYQTSISRDPSYKEYLDKIGQLFFGLPPPKKQNQGLFGNLLQSLLGEDDDSMQQSTSSSLPSSHSQDLSNVELD